MAPVPGKRLLERIIARVYAAGQESASQEIYQLHTITLRLLARLREGREATLDDACYDAFGMRFGKWQKRNMERTARLAWELSACVPDYDPAEARHAAMVKAGEVRGQQPSGGPVLAWPTPREDRPTVEKPVQRLSEKSKTAG